MSTHVDLMKSGEYRRQGAVSGAFVVRMFILSTVGLGLIFGGLSFMHYQIARQDLVAAREMWKTREPMYNTAQAMRSDLTELQKIQEELGAWSRARVNWDIRLLQLQRLVSPPMQFRRLTLRGDHEFVRDRSGTSTAAAKPGRKYVMIMEGRIVSMDPVFVVRQFMDGLEGAENFRELLEGVRMPEGLKQESSQEEIPEARFVVEVTSKRLEF